MVNIGAAKEILTTVASGNSLSAIKIATSAIKPDVHLSACNGMHKCKSRNLSFGITKK